MPAMHEVLDWIETLTTDEIDTVTEALQQRCDAIHLARSLNRFSIGTDVQIVDVTPQYLEGLAGEIIEIEDSEHVTVLLDHYSTGRLRFGSHGDYAVGMVARFPVPHVPRSCCTMATEFIDTDAAESNSLRRERSQMSS